MEKALKSIPILSLTDKIHLLRKALEENHIDICYDYKNDELMLLDTDDNKPYARILFSDFSSFSLLDAVLQQK